MTSERLLDASEVAERLGFAAGTIVDWAEAETLPAFKLGGRLRFRESEVLAWLETQRWRKHPADDGRHVTLRADVP